MTDKTQIKKMKQSKGKGTPPLKGPTPVAPKQFSKGGRVKKGKSCK